ncbi:MarR family winged helix-turn-helix transcriptional regulator [Sphaerisporangium viridialbum]|uniref:MarR family winged helix-turn-helix transcriptional regulator n=1 Tax=Sphaerisporangium viridialbum TaxID=46189 RepID=UPI003C77955A
MASEDSCGELLVRLSDMGAVMKAVKRDLPFAGSRAGLALLVALSRCGEVRMGELAEMFEVDQSVISRHVADLQERGWIERIPNPRDGRSWYVRLTPDGRQVTEELLDHVRHLLADTLGDWTDEEIAELAGLLARLRTSFDARRAHTIHASRTAQTVKGH